MWEYFATSSDKRSIMMNRLLGTVSACKRVSMFLYRSHHSRLTMVFVALLFLARSGLSVIGLSIIPLCIIGFSITGLCIIALFIVVPVVVPSYQFGSLNCFNFAWRHYPVFFESGTNDAS